MWEVIEEAAVGEWGGERGREERRFSMREQAGSAHWGPTPEGPLGHFGVVPPDGEEQGY